MHSEKSFETTEGAPIAPSLAPSPSQAPFVLYASLTCLFGVLNSVTGPVVPDLQRQAGVDSAGIGVIFMYRGLGSMAGGFLVGFIVDAVRDPHSVLVVLLGLRAVVEFTMPFSSSFVMLCIQFCLVAFSANAIATVSSTSVSWTYGKFMGPQLNLINAAFGVGASCAPALAALSRCLDGRAINAYWAIGASDLLFVVAVLAVPSKKNPRFDAGVAPIFPSNQANPHGHEKELDVDWVAVWLCGGSVLFAGVCEFAVAFWLFTYSTEELKLTDGAAGTVNTIFFVSFTATRFLCGWLVNRIGASCIMRGGLVLAFVSSIGLACSQSGALLPCLGMVGIGIGISPFAANCPTVLGQKTCISGRAQGLLKLMAACGAMIGASGTGFLKTWPLGGAAAMPTVVVFGLFAETWLTLALIRRCR